MIEKGHRGDRWVKRAKSLFSILGSKKLKS